MAKCEHFRTRSACSICKPHVVFKIYERHARKRGLAFTLTLDQFLEIIGRGECVFCGERGPLGIDRRNSNLGYVPENCDPACGECNRMKSNRNNLQFLRHIQKIAKYQEELRQRKQKSIQPPERPVGPTEQAPPIMPPRSQDLNIPLVARRYLDGN